MNRTLHSTFISVAALVLGFTSTATNAADKKPGSGEAPAGKSNILVLWGDDIGYGNVDSAYYGCGEDDEGDDSLAAKSRCLLHIDLKSYSQVK